MFNKRNFMYQITVYRNHIVMMVGKKINTGCLQILCETVLLLQQPFTKQTTNFFKLRFTRDGVFLGKY